MIIFEKPEMEPVSKREMIDKRIKMAIHYVNTIKELETDETVIKKLDEIEKYLIGRFRC